MRFGLKIPATSRNEAIKIDPNTNEVLDNVGNAEADGFLASDDFGFLK